MRNFNVSARTTFPAARAVRRASSAGSGYARLPFEITLMLEPCIPIGGGVADERGRPLPRVRPVWIAAATGGGGMGRAAM